MTTLLIIIYVTFISLGLPDAVLGSSWPRMYMDLNSSIASAGLVAMIICGGTIISSLFSSRLINRWGTAHVTIVSVLLTAIALGGIAFVPNFIWLCLLAVPLGLGAGGVDSALNNFVALHYNAKHMNWLHCFWGIGATSGPLLMALFLMKDNGWRTGYLVIGVLQIILVLVLFITLPMWKRAKITTGRSEVKAEVKISVLLKIKGAKSALVGFFCFCAIEMTAGLWGSTYLVLYKDISVVTAAKWVSFFYIGVTVGRFIAGLISVRVSNINMIRGGQFLIIVGATLMIIPLTDQFQLMGFIILGLGCAPIYPSMLHETPHRFGKEISQGIMGIQMATAYIGSTFVPPLVGYATNRVGFGIFPIVILGFVVLMMLSTENINRILRRRKDTALAGS
ncbi:MFS transporter [Brochothrix thermosphacta]|uniref:MFS transporter n=1 Tax=Brochothrix thermosphacta TaxID=2756 RepID=UPI001C4FA7EB|nr:MFS transporter [Brochothrix thermosphacta]